MNIDELDLRAMVLRATSILAGGDGLLAQEIARETTQRIGGSFG
jgi:hypothetical protein